MEKLTVVNRMLATLGQNPLNSLQSNNRWLGSCLSTLDQYDREIQAKGWWYNSESLTLAPSAEDSQIYLPGDTISVMPVDRDLCAQRGNRLYNLHDDAYTFTRNVDVTLIRLVPFESVPELVAAYIAAEAVYWFQDNYDGDTQRSRSLNQRRLEAKAEAKTEDITQRRVNRLDSNPGVQLVRSFNRRSGYRIPVR